MRPMLATHGTDVPVGPEWLHEVKWDGIRVLVEVRAGSVRLWSRNENDVTAAYPELAGLAEALAPHDDVVLDGEVVAFEGGVPRFGALADRMHVRSARKAATLARSNPVTLMLFDVLRLDGQDVTGLPLVERRALLEELGLGGPRWQVPPAYDDGRTLYDATKAQQLEGVVSKRRTSTYHPGRRSADWVKLPHRASASYVVGGWRTETGSGRLGAVLVGEPTPDGLRYRGRVGSGLAGRRGKSVLERLRGLEADESPFSDAVPKVDADGTTWLRPELVVEVAALGLTREGRLRQPSFLGLRTDVTPDSLVEPVETDRVVEPVETETEEPS